jgi:hypothetical protein
MRIGALLHSAQLQFLHHSTTHVAAALAHHFDGLERAALDVLRRFDAKAAPHQVTALQCTAAETAAALRNYYLACLFQPCCNCLQSNDKTSPLRPGLPPKHDGNDGERSNVLALALHQLEACSGAKTFEASAEIEEHSSNVAVVCLDLMLALVRACPSKFIRFCRELQGVTRVCSALKDRSATDRVHSAAARFLNLFLTHVGPENATLASTNPDFVPSGEKGDPETILQALATSSTAGGTKREQSASSDLITESSAEDTRLEASASTTSIQSARMQHMVETSLVVQECMEDSKIVISSQLGREAAAMLSRRVPIDEDDAAAAAMLERLASALTLFVQSGDV